MDTRAVTRYFQLPTISFTQNCWVGDLLANREYKIRVWSLIVIVSLVVPAVPLEHFDRCVFFLLAFLSPGSRDLHGPFGQQSLLREATWLESSFSDHWNWYYANERADLTQVIPSCHRLHLIAVSSRHLHSPQVSGVHNVDHACLRSNQSYSLRRRPVYV